MIYDKNIQLCILRLRPFYSKSFDAT